ncbi:MAG: hypothetical protein AAB643_01730 [Patescibacteria group bacterium]
MNHIFLLFLSLALAAQPLVIGESNANVDYASSFAAPKENELKKSETSPIIKEVHEVWVTAYSSTPEETDDTPFITASGKETKDGVLAANFLPFGTRVIIPEVTGDKVFIVEDRMHRRKTEFVDVWMSTKEEAVKFGIVRAKIAVLD